MRKRRESCGGRDPLVLEMEQEWLHRNTTLRNTKDSRDYNGKQEFESGPSRITIDDLERMEGCEAGSVERCGICFDYSAPPFPLSILTSTTSISTFTNARRRTSRRRRIALAAALAIPFLPYASAAPPYRPDQTESSAILHPPTITPSPIERIRNNPRQEASSSSFSVDPSASASASASASGTEAQSRLDEEEIDYDIKYLTSMSTPTHALPTAVYMVAETRLPFYLSQDPEGSWTKVDDAWLLYGRQAGVATAVFGPDEDPIATAVPTSLESGVSGFAITDALPPGWGIEATRSEFYRTPLIVAMSVILALMIVAGIIFIVINRRKQHRRAKRRAARMRRKALAAAGITEDDLNNDNDGVDSALREKLAQIEGTTRPKPKTRKREKERGPTTLIRTKVRAWNQGVLRRRNQAVGLGPGLGPSRSATPSIEVIDQEDKPDDPNLAVNRVRGSNDTDRTTPTVASQSSNERGGGTLGSAEITTSDSNTNETPSSSELPRAVTQPPTATYFPPAYRPASVRSLQVNTSGPSAPARSSSTPSPSNGVNILSVNATRPVTGVEKTTAPGYYPAPATHDSEMALAVASRSDGKQRMDAPPLDEEEEQDRRVRHIATDDKGALERMRLGGSAPPAAVAPNGDADGPSAPIVEVDEQGFEAHDPITLGAPLADSPDMTGGAQATSSQLPAPPARPRMGYRVYSQDDLAADLDIQEHHLLPSAPPPAHEDHLALVPSAPPALEEESSALAPSAPAFDVEDDVPVDEEEQEVVGSNPDPADGADGSPRTGSGSIPDHGDNHLEEDRDSAEEGDNHPSSDLQSSAEIDHARKPSLPTYEP